METNSATYELVESNYRLRFIIIRDVGLWDRQLTITNDAEAVVEALYSSGRLGRGTRLFYYDSEGELDEILLKYEPVEGKGGIYYPAKFAGFAHCTASSHHELSTMLEERKNEKEK